MALASLGSLAAIAVTSVSHALGAPLVWAVERAVWLMSHSVEPFSRARLASLRVPDYEGWRACAYVVYYLPLAYLVSALARWRPLELAEAKGDGRRAAVRQGARRAAWVAFAASAFVVVAHPVSAPRADGRLRVDFLDVGQGDAALLTMPDGSTLLVDGGGRPTFGARAAAEGADFDPARFERDARGIGDAVVSEFLWSRGLDRVDYLLATHAHADHIDGLKDVARNFRVRAALVARTPPRAVEYAEFAEAMRVSNVPVRVVARGDVLRFGAATVEVLHPTSSPALSTGDESNAGALPSGNDDSVVLRVRYGARCFLLTGDIERGAEGALVAAGDDLRCDVVKVAHHGSRTSSTAEFVAATRPAFAVVSVGLASPFGHPDQGVVERWRASGAQVLQTGRRGTISFTTDGQDLRVETFARE
ncbi:MAG: MBL fold metallo-hydrolase [Acidobacteria bacterium]|nr:MBL fold metallo-hydrolase [Acidobacteriota bacterium]